MMNFFFRIKKSLVILVICCYVFTYNILFITISTSPEETNKSIIHDDTVNSSFFIDNLDVKNISLLKEDLTELVRSQNYDSCNYLNIISNDKSELCDLLITVKTTKNNYATRLKSILDTWYNLAPSKIYIITDENNKDISKLTNNHLISSNCGKSHDRESLVCKMTVEFETYLKYPSRWFCHVDDDTYVNIQQLYKFLSKYDSDKLWYFGKISTATKITSFYNNTMYSYSFGTGGAGFCISYPVALKMIPYMKEFNKISTIISLPDDVSFGFIIEGILGINLTNIDNFHSHLEYLGFFNNKNLKDQITLSYSLFNKNLVDLKSNYNYNSDPTRFKTIHCLLYPNSSRICNNSTGNNKNI